MTTTPSRPIAELTLRGILLGGLITLLFTAANVYLGLKLGITFATSIPAAVISMALLRNFKDSTIQENNNDKGNTGVSRWSVLATFKYEF